MGFFFSSFRHAADSAPCRSPLPPKPPPGWAPNPQRLWDEASFSSLNKGKGKQLNATEVYTFHFYLARQLILILARALPSSAAPSLAKPRHHPSPNPFSTTSRPATKLASPLSPTRPVPAPPPSPSPPRPPPSPTAPSTSPPSTLPPPSPPLKASNPSPRPRPLLTLPAKRATPSSSNSKPTFSPPRTRRSPSAHANFPRG